MRFSTTRNDVISKPEIGLDRCNVFAGSLGHWFSTWTMRSPRRVPHQVSKGPQQNDRNLGVHTNFWMGLRNVTAWIKKKIQIKKIEFSPSSSAAQKAKLLLPHLIWLNLVSVGWPILCQKCAKAFILRKEKTLACYCTHSNQTFIKLASVYLGQQHTEYNASY